MKRSRPDPWPDYEYRSNSESLESGLDRSRPRYRYEGSRSRYEQSPPRERSEYETRRSYDFSPRRDDRETGAGYRLERSQRRWSENREENILSMSPRYREEDEFIHQPGRREEDHIEERTDGRISQDFDNRENDGYSARFPNSSRYQDVNDVSHRFSHSSYVDRITGPLRSNNFDSPPRKIVYEESKTNPFDRLGPKAEVSDDEFYSTDRIDDDLGDSFRFRNLHSSWTEHKPNLDLNFRTVSRDKDNEYSGDHIRQPSYATAFSKENCMENFEIFPQQTVRQEFQERRTVSPVQDFYPERDVSVDRPFSQLRHAFSTSTSESEAKRRSIQDKSYFPGESRQVGSTYDEWKQSTCRDRLKSVRDSQELRRDPGGNRKLDRGEFSLRRGEEARRQNSLEGRELAARMGEFVGREHVERMDYPSARKQVEEREQQEIKREYPENFDPWKRKDGLDQEKYPKQRSGDHQNTFSSPLSMSKDKISGTKISQERKLSSDLSRSTSRGRSGAIKERKGNQDKKISSGRSSSDRKYHLEKGVSSGSIGKTKKDEALRSSMMDFTDSRRLSRTSFQQSDSRNSTSSKRANSVKRKKIDEADKLRLLLLEEELKRTKEKLMKTEMKEKKNTLVSRRDVPLDEHQIDKPKLPSKLYETECFVVLVQDMTECGVVEMVGGDGTHVYAFFYKHDAITSQDGNDKMSVKFPIGLKLKANAWLVNEDNKIPYIIASLWSPDVILPSSIMSKINSIEPEQNIMRMYTSLSPDLSWKLTTNRCIPRNRDEIVMYEDHIKASNDSSVRKRKLSSDVDVVIIPDIIKTDLLNSPPKISPIKRETQIVNFEEEARKKLMLLSAHSYTGRNSNIQQNKKETEEVSQSNLAKGTHSCSPPPTSHFFNQGLNTNLQQNAAMKTEAFGSMTANSTKLCPPPPSGHCFTYQDKSTNFQQNMKVTEVFGNLPEKQVKVWPPPSQSHNIFYDDEKINKHHNVAVTGVYENMSADSNRLCPPPPPGHFFAHQEKTLNFQSNLEATNKFGNIPANSASVQICPQPPPGYNFTHQDEGTYTQQNMQKTEEFRNMSVGNAELGTQFPPTHLVKGITCKENMQKTEETINSVVNNVVFWPSKSSDQFNTEQKDMTNYTYHNSLSANTNYTCLNSVFTQSQIAEQAFPTRQGSMIALHEKPSPQSSYVKYSVPLKSLSEESEYQESYLNYEVGKNQSSDNANLQLAPCFGKPLPTTSLEKSHHTSPHKKIELNNEDIPIFGKQMPKSAEKTSFHFPSRSIAAKKMFEETLSDNSLKVSMHLKTLSKVRSTEISLDNDNTDIDLSFETPEDETEVLFGKPINDEDKYEQFTLKVNSYISNIGILKISSSQKLIFHANQVWVKQPCSIKAYCPFLEIFPSDCLEKEIPIGTRVCCLAIKVSKTYYQAVVLWKEDNHDFPPRALEIARDSKSELKQVFDEFVFPTGSKYCGDVSEPRPYLKGYIQDYITYELGIIKVSIGESDKRYYSALFHLDQVWTACKKGRFSLLKDSTHKSPPKLYLPVGTEVCFVYRDLPCESSHLKFQAYAVWKNTDNFKLPRQIGSIFNEYTAYYSEKRNQENLIDDLNCKHEILKQHTKLYSPNPFVIPVVLNGLPENWVAVISDLYNCGFGLIKISHLEPGKDLSAALKLDVPELYCVFHYSTFFLKNGKCCSNKDKYLIRQGNHVNLIARSIIPEQSSASIFRVVKAHMQFGSKLPYISMQAVVVIHESSEQSYYCLPDNVPQPVVMNMKPISFNSDQNNTQVYMNINLMDTLKTQLYKQILLNGLFKKRVILTGVDNFMRNFELNPVIEPCDRDKLYQELDTNRTRDLIFGVFRQHVSYGNFNFPALLQDVSCQVAHISLHYRYQPTEGILSIDLDGTKVQAFVEFANLKLAGLNALPPLRIEEIAPVYMNLEFKCVAHLVTTVGCVQYVCTNIYSKHHKFQGALPAVSPAKLCNYQSAMKRLCPNDPVSACVTQTGSLNIGKPAGPVFESNDFRQTSTCNISQSQNCITDIKKFGTVNTETYDSSPLHRPVDKPLTNDSEALKIFGQQCSSKEIFPRSSHTCNEPMSSTLKQPVKSSEDYDPESVYDSDNEHPETPNEGALNKEKNNENLIEFERQVLDKKKTKKEEFLQMKRKVRWAKLVLQIEVKKMMKSPNNFLCSTCGFEGGLSEAEKHLKEDIHWDNMFDVYCKELDTVKPQTFGNQKRLIENHKSKPKPLNVFEDSSDDDCLEGVLVSEPENSSVQSTLEVKVNKAIKFKFQFKGNDTEKSECLSTTSSMPSPITAFTNTGSNILLQKTETKISNINVKCSSIQDDGFTDEPKQVSDSLNSSKPPLVNFELPEIYMFTETKLSEMGNFQGKNSLLKKVGDCLEGDAQTLIKAEFSNVEKNILKIINQAHYVCTKLSCLEKELQSSRVHYNEWFCKYCGICSEGQEMEKHLKSNNHWTKVINAASGQNYMSKSLKTDSDIIRDVFGRVSLVLNEVVAIVSFGHENSSLHAVLDISGINNTSNSKIIKSKSDNMLTVLKKGYPVRMNLCRSWKTSHNFWYYATAAHIGDQADWEHPLPKPETVQSIIENKIREPIYIASTSFVKANEELLIKKLSSSYPEYLFNELVKIVLTSDDYCLGEIENIANAPFCVFTRALIKKNSNNGDIKIGELFKIGAYLLDHESKAPYLCHDFYPYSSSKCLEPIRHAELKQKQIDVFSSIIASSSFVQHKD